MRVEVFMLEDAVAKIGGILAEALKSFRYKQRA